LKTLVIGAGGQLGQTLRKTCPFPQARFLDHAALDLHDHATIERAIVEASPELVINAAAYTAVDRAESDSAGAFAVNGTAPGIIAGCCAALRSRFIHLSTDYVFDGRSERPYRPEDAPNPLNVYGASKLAGERAVQSIAGLDYLIVRTSWVYAEIGRNFFLTMLRLGRERDRLRVVADQIGSPTSTWTLADAIWRVARLPVHGIAHFTDDGAISWHMFATAIFEEAAAAGVSLRRVAVEPISAAEYPSPVARPCYSALDATGLRRQLELPAGDWRSALRDVVRRYAGNPTHV
jgi:dTDP-4-dehydrorhamnose reductase